MIVLASESNALIRLLEIQHTKTFAIWLTVAFTLESLKPIPIYWPDFEVFECNWRTLGTLQDYALPVWTFFVSFVSSDARHLSWIFRHPPLLSEVVGINYLYNSFLLLWVFHHPRPSQQPFVHTGNVYSTYSLYTSPFPVMASRYTSDFRSILVIQRAKELIPGEHATVEGFQGWL